MIRIIVICEGETEQEFCKKVQAKYLANKKIFVKAPLIKKSRGGIVKWKVLKKDIERYLRNDKQLYVTTLIDYYGIKPKHAFPKWEEAMKEPDKNKRMEILETAMKQDVAEELQARFLPYLQLHEFEGLLFSCRKVFDLQFEPEEFDASKLDEVFEVFGNPELINDTPSGCPSARLQEIIPGYNKVVYGAILAEAIGIDRIRSKCPRFAAWLTTIESLSSASCSFL